MSHAIVTLGADNIVVGDLRFEQSGRRQHSVFTYSEEWIMDERGFAFDPENMELSQRPYYASAQGDSRDAIPNAFSDSAPDSWGRKLLEKAYRRGLNEFDYLTLADDRTRQGALRFMNEDLEPFTGDQAPVPRIIDLEELAALSRRYEQDKDGAEAEARLLVGAIGSLGGARPKANVVDGDELWIAKFSSINDHSPVIQAEVGTLNLAATVGIRTAEARIELGRSDYPVALIRRFDRRGGARIPYISGKTALGLSGAALGYYSDLAEFLRRHSPRPQEDVIELWKRLVFTILVRNTDDHMKNHGFIYAGNQQWRLSPAFDVNPQPERNPQLKSGISDDHGFDPLIERALDAAGYFDVEDAHAVEIAREMAIRISATWRDHLGRQGLSGRAISGFAPAFEHEEMQFALAL